MRAGERRLRTRPQVHSSMHRRRRAAPIRKSRLASLNHRRDGDALDPPSGASHASSLPGCHKRELAPRWRSSARTQPSPEATGQTCSASHQCSQKFSAHKRGNQRCRACGAGCKRSLDEASIEMMVSVCQVVPACSRSATRPARRLREMFHFRNSLPRLHRRKRRIYAGCSNSTQGARRIGDYTVLPHPRSSRQVLARSASLSWSPAARSRIGRSGRNQGGSWRRWRAGGAS